MISKFQRRQFASLIGLASLCSVSSHYEVKAQTFSSSKFTSEDAYRIGVCDWMILKRQKLGAISLAKELGVDGVELDMGPLGDRETFENSLANAENRKRFRDVAEQLGIKFCSIAMSGFYAQSFAERPTYRRMISDCLTTMQQLEVKVGFLPLGVKNDLIQHPELRPAVVQRLKEVGKMAQDLNVTIGIETALDAAAEVQLLDDIGSQSIKSYFNFANALQQGRGLADQIKILGKDRICQIHCTDEDGVWLENNKRLDMIAVKKTLIEIGWRGWLVMERSRDAANPRDVKANYGANARYLKSIFSD